MGLPPLVTNSKIGLVVFAGSHGDSAPERLLAGCHAANARDLVELGLGCSFVDRIFVATNVDALAQALAGYDRVVVERDEPGVPFHFGRRLVDIVERYGIRAPLYFSASGAPLLAPESLDEICGEILVAGQAVVTNNAASADFFGTTSPEALRRIDLPGDQDNNVPYLLTRFGGLRSQVLLPAIENMFDIDTPTDLKVLKLVGQTKRHARAYLDSVALDTGAFEEAMPKLVQRATITLAGRVNTDLWGKNGSDIPAYKRIYADERNMKSSGRDVRGEVRSIIGYLYEAVGPERLFAQLAEMSDLICFDSRVLFAHLRLNLSPADRFASDLGDLDSIIDPTARAITAAATSCSVPVLLGGHNIVSGGLWALAQEAWNRADAGLISATYT